MRIAFDEQAFVLQSYGGVSRYVTQLAQGLLNAEQEVAVFAPLHRNSYLQALPREAVFGRHVKRYPPKTARLFFAYNRFLSRPDIAAWKPDLVHETYYARFTSAPKATPVVVTVYDMIHELFAQQMSITDNTATIKRLAVGRADRVICISENTKRDLMNIYGISEDKLSVVHLGFDQFTATGKREGMEGLLSGKPFLLYVGARAGYKNFSGFLKAVASSKKLVSDFDIVAFGGMGFSNSELRLINDLGLREGKVRHTSGGDDVLGGLYDSARAFVYPSIYEGFGIPPLEAMAHGCPVISSKSSSMPEVIGDAGEYFEPAEIDDMTRAIEAVVYSDSRINVLRQLAKKRLASFSWGKCAQETLDVYRSIT